MIRFLEPRVSHTLSTTADASEQFTPTKRLDMANRTFTTTRTIITLSYNLQGKTALWQQPIN